MNVTTEGQAVTGVGQIQGRISAATEDVFIYLDYFGSSFFFVFFLRILRAHFPNYSIVLYLLYNIVSKGIRTVLIKSLVSENKQGTKGGLSAGHH